MAAPRMYKQRKQRRTAMLLLFVLLAMLVLATLLLAGNTRWVELMFVDERGYPGGPDAFFADEWSQSSKVISNASLVVLVLVNLALMVGLPFSS